MHPGCKLLINARAHTSGAALPESAISSDGYIKGTGGKKRASFTQDKEKLLSSHVNRRCLLLSSLFFLPYYCTHPWRDEWWSHQPADEKHERRMCKMGRVHKRIALKYEEYGEGMFNLGGNCLDFWYLKITSRVRNPPWILWQVTRLVYFPQLTHFHSQPQEVVLDNWNKVVRGCPCQRGCGSWSVRCKLDNISSFGRRAKKGQVKPSVTPRTNRKPGAAAADSENQQKTKKSGKIQ